MLSDLQSHLKLEEEDLIQAKTCDPPTLRRRFVPAFPITLIGLAYNDIQCMGRAFCSKFNRNSTGLGQRIEYKKRHPKRNRLAEAQINLRTLY